MAYFNQSVKGVGNAGYGFYAVVTTQPVVEYIKTLEWGEFLFQADIENKDTGTATKYKLVPKLIALSDIPTSNRRSTTSMNWFNIHMNTEAKAICMNGTSKIEGLARVLFNGANMRLTKLERRTDKLTKANLPTLRGEFELERAWYPTDMKKVLMLPISDNPTHDLVLDVSKQFCDTHGLHNQCLKLCKSTADTTLGDYCSCGRSSVGPSDLGGRRAQEARAQAAFQERRNKRKAATDPFE